MDESREFFDAIERDDARRVASLVGAQPRLARAAFDYDKTGLHWAAENDAVASARLLLDAGADLGARTSWGATALDWAATMGSARVADLLLDRGAGGLTLTNAAALGKLDVVRAIVESGAGLAAHRTRVTPGDPDEEWPADTALRQGDVLSHALYSAARNGHVPVVEYLLARGASADARGFFGATGLHWAAINGHAAMVDFLVARGANPDLEDARFHSTAAGWADEGGHGAIAAKLRSRSA